MNHSETKAEMMSTYPPLKNHPINVDWQSPTLRAMKRMLRVEARKSPHGGTPETTIKLRLRGGPPVERLRAARRIGPLELAAAEEIERAVTAISAGLDLKTVNLERIDRGSGRRPRRWSTRSRATCAGPGCGRSAPRPAIRRFAWCAPR
jgi:hypothetical protein